MNSTLHTRLEQKQITSQTKLEDVFKQCENIYVYMMVDYKRCDIVTQSHNNKCNKKYIQVISCIYIIHFDKFLHETNQTVVQLGTGSVHCTFWYLPSSGYILIFCLENKYSTCLFFHVVDSNALVQCINIYVPTRKGLILNYCTKSKHTFIYFKDAYYY